MDIPVNSSEMDKAARCGEPSYVWRSGQMRRLKLIIAASGERCSGVVLENGCGVGMYLEQLDRHARIGIGLEYDRSRAVEARQRSAKVICAAGEDLPFGDNHFDLILSHEVLEHVTNDRKSLEEMVRTLKPGGRIVLFVPNRGYPFETHGIFWRGKYHFGNIPLVNYLPDALRNRLAPHVRIYTSKDLAGLVMDLPLRVVQRTILFGAYDNIIARWPGFGQFLRSTLQALENTPLRWFGLSHFWALEKTE